MRLDKQIFIFLNGLAHKSRILDGLWVFLAQYAIFIFALALIYLLRKDRKLFLKAASAALITVIAVALIKKIWFLPRPFLKENARLLMPHILDSTFPSKHAAVSFALALGIFLEKKKLGLWLLILAFLISLSRIVAGVHYPSDIFAGALIGAAIAYINHKFIPRGHKTAGCG